VLAPLQNLRVRLQIAPSSQIFTKKRNIKARKRGSLHWLLAGGCRYSSCSFHLPHTTGSRIPRWRIDTQTHEQRKLTNVNARGLQTLEVLFLVLSTKAASLGPRVAIPQFLRPSLAPRSSRLTTQEKENAGRLKS
jgi:hypothetical protein